MGLYTNFCKQIDKYDEVDSMKMSISKRIFYSKVIVLLLLIFDEFMNIKCFI